MSDALRRALLVIAPLIWLAPSRLLAQGCAMCKTALNGPADPLSAGINASIFFLMSMPFALAASVGVWLAYMYRGRQRRPEWEDFDSKREGSR